MNKKLKIALIIIVSLIGVVYVSYLFLIPGLINLNTFTPQIKDAAKQATGLDVDPGKLKLNTYYDFSVKLTAENVKVDKFLTLEKASARVLLFPLIFKKLEIKEVKIDKPEVFLTRLKNGKYDIEKVLEKQNAPQENIKPANAVADSDSATPVKPQSPTIEPVFKGMNLSVSDYKIYLTDTMGTKEKNFVLKGDILKISKFNPDKFIKLTTNGSLLVEDNPNINFDIKLASDLPLIKPAKVNKQVNPKVTDAVTQKHVANKTQQAVVKKVDPIEKLLTYDPKVNIKADLQLKSRETLPDINGNLNFDKLSLKIDGQTLPDSNGTFDFSGKTTKVNSKLFITPESFIEISGNIKDLAKQEFDINVKSNEIQLKDVKKFAYSIADAANADVSALNDIALSGIIKADFNLQKENFQGYLNIIDTTLSHKDISQPLKNFTSTLNFNKDKVEFQETSGKLADIGFDITGYVNSKLFSDIKVNVANINLPTVYNILYNSRMFADIKPQLKEISDLKGSAKAEVLIKGQLDEQIAPEVIATINNISAYHKPSKTPISVSGGNINLDKKGAVNFKNIKTTLADMNLDIAGQFTGDANNWNLTSESGLNNVEFLKGNNKLALNAKGTPKSVYIDNSGLYSDNKKVVSVDGSINNFTDLNNVKVNISGLNLIIKEPKGTAQLNGKLVLTGKTDAPKALGTISLTSLEIPSLVLKTNDIDINLKEDSILVNTGVLNLDDSKIKLFAVIQNKLTPPFIVNQVEINSDYLNIDKLTQALATPQQTAQGNSPQNKTFSSTKPVNNTKKTASAGNAQPADIPVIINQGKFTAKELIVNKLQNKDVSFDFTLKPLNNLAIRHFTTHVAGGVAVGLADMDLKTTKLGVDVTAENIEINALATVLANMPNEVFGGMNGKIKLSTIGQTPELMMQNAVGRVDFIINNGHLGTLGNLCYLFKTRSINFDEADKTNHFDKMEGLINVKNGILDIQQISMQGKRMSSFISGTVRMADNYSDLTVLSKLSGKIVSQLGFIADISVNKLIKKIPGKWGELLAETRASNLYPNREKIPALNADPLENDKDFAVKIKGILGQPTSVRMIEWLE